MGIFKAYDIRGVFPDEINEDIVYNIGRALVVFLKCKNVVVGNDMRLSGPVLKKALIDGITDQGADVIDIGLCSTDMFYFAVSFLKADGGATITASHNPKEYNGVKMTKKNAEPIGEGSGMEEIEELAEQGEFKDCKKGKVTEAEVLDDFVKMVKGFVDVSKIKRLRVVMDGCNGMAGMIAPKVFEGLPLDRIELYFELDGSFPNHGPNPLLKENHKEAVKRVLKEKADLGIMWDADTDRCFFIDEKGRFIEGDFITGIIAEHMLKKNPGKEILYDLRASRFVPDIIEKNKGKPKKVRVGHAFFKKYMKKDNAVFGGEVTGHYYYNFGDFYADNGYIPALQILEFISQEGKSLSEIMKIAKDYHKSEEINSEVKDKDGKLKEIEKHYKKDAKKIEHLDGLTIEFDDWWFNLRKSNTEPVIRLNLEASSEKLMKGKLKEVLKLINMDIPSI